MGYTKIFSAFNILEKWRLNILKYFRFMPHFTFIMFKNWYLSACKCQRRSATF